MNRAGGFSWNTFVDGVITGAGLLFIVGVLIVPLLGVTDIQGEVFASLLGSLVGGGFTAVVTRLALDRTFQDQLRLQQKATVEEERGQAFALYVGIEEMTSRLAALKRHVDECLGNNEAPPDAEPWQLLLPTVRYPIPERFFDVTALKPLFSEKAYEILAQLFVAQRNIVGKLLAMDLYAEMRNEIKEKIIPDRLDGLVAHAEIEAADARWLEGRASELNHLVAQVVDGLDEQLKELLALLDPISRLLKGKFGPDFPALTAA